MQVTGLPFTPELTGIVTGINYRSAVPTVGNLVFPSSANTLNQLQHAIQWGQASNLMGNPSGEWGLVKQDSHPTPHNTPSLSLTPQLSHLFLFITLPPLPPQTVPSVMNVWGGREIVH